MEMLRYAKRWKEWSGKKHTEGLPAEHRPAEGVVRYAGDKVVWGTTLHRVPTYKSVRRVRFTNALLAMLLMVLLLKYLRMKAH